MSFLSVLAMIIQLKKLVVFCSATEFSVHSLLVLWITVFVICLCVCHDFLTVF